MTLQTIADRLGVSRMTVSNAFSRPDQLSAELRQRILDTAGELGYAGPDPTARALAKGTTGAIGVLLTDSLGLAFTDEVATRFLGAIVDGLAPSGLALTLLSATGHGDVVPARDVAIDGAVVYSCLVESDARTWLHKRGLPLVYVDQEPVPGTASINVDDRGGAGAAAQHLVDLGHRRIGIVLPLSDRAPGFVDEPLTRELAYPERQRLLGWLDALGAAGIVPAIVRTQVGTTDDRPGVIDALLDLPEPPTAVLCFSDVLALDVIRVLRSRGQRAPDGLSVVGFDDTPAAQRADPPLTTVRQDIAEKGRLAAAALTAAIESARIGTKQRLRHHVLPTELVVRNTTGPPSSEVVDAP